MEPEPLAMDKIKESRSDVPVVHETDVCVLGGSCTGVFAAVRAARLGMRAAIVEKQNCFGGMATAGAVNIWHSLKNTDGTLAIIGGLTEEVLARLEKRRAVTRLKRSSAFVLNTEELKIDLDELINEHRIKPFLHTFYAASVVKNDLIKAVIIENKNGRQAVRAKVFVDATGDGDLAIDAGLQAREPGPLQPPTACAKIYGLGSLSNFDWQAAVREHGPEFGLEADWGWGAPVPGMPDLQMRADSHVFNVDASDAEQLTCAEMEGRRRVRAVMDIIRKYGPPDASIALADLAAAIGIRETRKISARYRLTGDDVLYGRKFEDAVAYGSYPVDIHHADSAGITFRYLDGTERVVPGRGMQPVLSRWREETDENPTFYQIPFRCLSQERIPNLVLAGRMLDADKIAFSAVRVMVNMNQTGEAAGTAAAVAVKNNCPVYGVDARCLREKMKEGGSIIL